MKRQKETQKLKVIIIPIRNATEAELAVRWWQVLTRILEIAVPCGVVGFILIVFGRTMPPPVPIPQRQVVNRFSKY
jgi:hypothetical protein